MTSQSPSVPDSQSEDEGKQSAAVRLLVIARRDYEFGLLTGEIPYAVRKNGPRIARVFLGDRSALRASLAFAFEQENGHPPNQNALSQTLTTLEGQARHEHPVPVDLPMRVARHDGELVVDLGDQTGRAVVVNAGGWKVVDRSPVLFLRTELTGELPEPQRGGKLSRHLFPLLNLNPDDRKLIAAVLVSWLWPDITHPVLNFQGEEGTGKTTVTRILRRMADPSKVETQRLPGRDEDWETTIAGQWIVALNNMSGLPDWLSDAICTAADGSAGDVKRRKYSDHDLAILQVRRCLILNSIDSITMRGDLVDRTITFGLEPIRDNRTETSIYEKQAEVWPLALGALLDLAAKVVAVMPEVPPDDRNNRLADFAQIAAALDRCVGGKGKPAVARYREKMADAVSGAVGADAFALALVVLAQNGGFDGTIGELFERHVRPGAAHDTVPLFQADLARREAALSSPPMMDMAKLLEVAPLAAIVRGARVGPALVTPETAATPHGRQVLAAILPHLQVSGLLDQVRAVWLSGLRSKLDPKTYAKVERAIRSPEPDLYQPARPGQEQRFEMRDLSGGLSAPLPGYDTPQGQAVRTRPEATYRGPADWPTYGGIRQRQI